MILTSHRSQIAFIKKSLIFHNLFLASLVNHLQIIFKQVNKDLSLCLINILNALNRLEVKPMLTFIDILVHSVLELNSN